jgi:PKD repeat protein
VTLGQISEVNVTVTVCYAAIGPFCVQAARYVNQFAIGGGTFSAGGDSGSLIVTQSGHNPVGLLFAGSSTRTIANRIQAVLAWFDVTIDSANGSTNNSPTANFTSACTGLSCNFDGTGSSDTDGTVQNYAWNFGDGNTASGAGATVSHSYATGGSYAVTLTVTDNGGATGQTSHSTPSPKSSERPAARAVGLGPTQEIKLTTLTGTWGGTIYAVNGTTYPLTMTFSDDGT